MNARHHGLTARFVVDADPIIRMFFSSIDEVPAAFPAID
jgi:hypothetical protein